MRISTKRNLLAMQAAHNIYITCIAPLLQGIDGDPGPKGQKGYPGKPGPDVRKLFKIELVAVTFTKHTSLYV